MKRRILRDMLLITLCAMLLFAALMTAGLYRLFSDRMHSELEHELNTLAAAMEYTKDREGMLGALRAHGADTRYTWISADGTVLFDSTADGTSLENHSAREEVTEALAAGSGRSSRRADTLGETTYSCAMRLTDGSVIRLAASQKNALGLLAGMLPYIGLMLALILLVSSFLSARMTRAIVAPISSLDPDSPEAGEVYEELKPLVERLTHHLDDHEAAERSRREFSANVSHELKTPLTSISGYAEIMKSGLAPEKDMREFAGRIHEEATRLVALIEDIIHLSRLDENDVHVQTERLDLAAIARDVCRRLQPRADKHGVSVRVSADPAFLQGARSVLDEMIYNLVDNAIKYNKPGGSVEVRISSSFRTLLSVHDTGIGIALEDQERVFERFYRVDKSHSREIGGTGLGLSIVKHAALYHNAEIEIDSVPGRGTEIRVLFPPESAEPLPPAQS